LSVQASSDPRSRLVEFLVVVEKGKSSYGAYVPDLPGCVAVGASRREVLKLIREGIRMHIAALRDAGEPVPTPSSRSEVVRIQAA
jgi:predicted RNase H-like HicB family nuclease